MKQLNCAGWFEAPDVLDSFTDRKRLFIADHVIALARINTKFVRFFSIERQRVGVVRVVGELKRGKGEKQH